MSITIFVIAAVVVAGGVFLWLMPKRPDATAAAEGDATDRAAADDVTRRQVAAPVDKAPFGYRPHMPPPPVAPILIDAQDAPDDAAATDRPGAIPLERVAMSMSLLDISPDSQEALFLHDANCVTLYDIKTGKALKTWRDICPATWLKHLGDGSGANCAKRRIVISWIDAKVDEADAETVLIDLERRTVTRILANRDGADAPQILAISGDGRFAASLATYSKSHPTFDLDHPREMTPHANDYSAFGDFKLAPGTLWPPFAISADGRWFAFDQGDEDVVVMRQTDPTNGLDARPWSWPDYHEHMGVIGDGQPALLAFNQDSDKLLVLDDAGGLAMADLNARDFRLLKPFDEAPDATYFTDLTWIAGRNQALITIAKPEPNLALIDLSEGVKLRDWAISEGEAVSLRPLPNGGAVLMPRPNGAWERMSLI